jgi:hypothetical protein
MDELEQKGLLKDGEVEESILDSQLKQEAVSKEELIEYDYSEEQVESEYEGSVSKARFPYYKSDDVVYDPLIEQEI